MLAGALLRPAPTEDALDRSQVGVSLQRVSLQQAGGPHGSTVQKCL